MRLISPFSARGRLLPVLLPALLAGCASVPHETPVLKPLDEAVLGPAPTPTPAPAAPLAADWWHALGDPQLDRIMADAFAHSPTLADAEARIRAARAVLAMEKGPLAPQITGSAGTTQERFSAKYIYPAPYGGGWFWDSEAAVSLNWSLDLAGRQKAMVAAVRAAGDALVLDAAAARVSLGGAVAEAYVNLARAERQLAIAREFTASRTASLEVVRNRRTNQLASDLDVASAETLLAEARQAEIRAAGNRALMVHALAALAGHGADYYATIGAPTLQLEGALPVPQLLPADLLGRRPDILAARANVAAARAGVRSAQAAFYPDVNLTAFVGASALGIGSLFTSQAITAGAGPALSLPIFEGGALKGKYRASLAGEDMAIAAYNRAVIGAVKEVADALSQVATRAEDAEAQHAITRGLDETLRLDHVRLASGLAGRLDALAAGQRLLSARQAETDIIADGLVQRIRLAVALGGGFAPSAATATASADTPFMRPVSMRSGAPVQTVAPAHTAAR